MARPGGPRARIALLIALLLAGGCGWPGAATPPGIRPPEVFDPADVPLYRVHLEWRRTYPRAVSLAVTPDGGYVIVTGPLAGDRPAVELVRTDGTRAWARPLPGEGLARAYVAAAEPAADRILVVAAGREQGGEVFAFDLAGDLVWWRGLMAPVSARVARDASRTALINHVLGKLVLVDARGEDVGEPLDVSPRVVAEFADRAYLLVSDRSLVRVVDPRGRVVRRFEVDEDLQRRLAVDDGGRRVAVVTAGGEDAVYLFDAPTGGPRRAPLFPGGRNVPRFAPGAGPLYVFDVGDRAGLYAFDDRQLAVRWRLFTRSPGWSLAQLAAGSQGVLAHYVRRDQGKAVHAWVRVSEDGRPVARYPLPDADGTFLPTQSDQRVIAVHEKGDELEVRAYRTGERPPRR